MRLNQLLQRIARARHIALAGAVATPVLTVLGFGVYAIFSHEHAKWIALSIAAISFVLWGFYKALDRYRKREFARENVALSLVETPLPSHWGEHEKQIVEDLKPALNELFSQSSGVGADTGHLVKQAAALVAERCGKQVGDVHPVELLVMTEVLSQRFRQKLRKIPFVEGVTIQRLIGMRGAVSNVQLAIDTLAPVYKVVRLVTNWPALLLDQAKEFIVGESADLVKEGILDKLKSALIDEFLIALINLYSGYYAFALEEIDDSKACEADSGRLVDPPEPIRIVIVGQISSGKSTLTNAIAKSLLAEVDYLPTTGDVSIYEAMLDDEQLVRLVDTPGLDGSEAPEAKALAQIADADLVLWTLKANHPARQVDVGLIRAMDAFFGADERMQYRRPPIVGVMTHADQLLKANGFERPLSEMEEAEQALINDAVAFNQRTLSIDKVLPVSLIEDSESVHFSELLQTTKDLMDDAIHVQLGRRRRDHAERNAGLKAQVARFKETLMPNQ